jgi:TRAP-type C4-dicarboxylate transport system permease small subunit
MKRLLAATETVAAVFLLLIALLTAGNVLLRDLFAIQVPDWFDGSKLLMCIALFWGMAVTTYHSGHICVDALWEHLGAANRRRVDLLAGAVTVVFLAPMAWMVWNKVANIAALGVWRVVDVWHGRDPHESLRHTESEAS